MEKADVLRRKIEETVLTVCQSGSWHGMPYCWSDYTFENEGTPTVIAKYLFTFTDAEEWNVLFSSREEFISDCIIPCYYAQNGDISWNLYWISVLEQKQLERLDVQKRILFSGNTEYTRNFFAALEHLQDSVPAGRVTPISSEENIPMPSDDWIRQLESLGMAFCLDEFSSSALDAYVQGDPVEGKEDAGSVSGPAAEQQIRRLCSASIPRSFRPHYFPKDWIIQFAPVNLLYGANGSGKTSLLSAIEFGITGEMRSPAISTRQVSDSDIVIAADIDGTLNELCTPRQEEKKKSLVHQWYKCQSNNCSGAKLNNLFHLFNYLSVEETFMFANQQPELSDAFSKILYGPETVEMWENRSQYLDECSKMLNRYIQEADQCMSRLSDIDKKPDITVDALNYYLSASSVSFIHAESVVRKMQQVQTILAAYDKVSGHGPVLSRANTRKRFGTLIINWKLCRDKIGWLVSEIEKTRRLKHQLQAESSDLAVERKRKATLAKQFEQAIKWFKFYCANRGSIDIYRDMSAQISCYKLRITRLRCLIDDLGSALKTPPERSASEIHEEMKQLQDRQSHLRQKQYELIEQMSAIERDNEHYAQLLTSFRAKGLDIYRLDKDRCTCPLCGAQGVTAERLKRYIRSEPSYGSQKVMDLHHASVEVDNELEAVSTRLKLLEPLHLAAVEYGEAMAVLRQDFPDLDSYSDLCGKYERTKKEFNILIDNNLRLESNLTQTLKIECAGGNCLQHAMDSRHELQKLLETHDFVLLESENDQELLNLADKIWHDFENKRRKIHARLVEIYAKIEEQSVMLDTYTEQHRMACKELTKNIDELEKTEEISLFWDKVSAFCDVPDMDGESFCSVYKRILHLAIDVVDSEKRNTEKAALKEREQLARDKAERCQALKTVLEKLRPPEEYANDFIKQNVDQVRRIFLALHSPQEFSHLDISNNKLVAFRGRDAVPVEQMSTGQRAALVIAMFFQMNFVCPHAPNFLLMDEPVANIDDLNVLAMLDFLRELVICRGTQLFFTTANRNIAKLFRRKFSFMGTGFQELDFLRENENSLTIRQQYYDQSSLVSSNIL